MCNTIKELDEKNDKEHKKFATEVKELKEKVATKEDVNALLPKINAASMISSIQKGIIVFATSLLLGLAGISTYFIAQTYEATKSSTVERIELNKVLSSINKQIEESNSVAKTFDAKQVMDSINKHWNFNKHFYNDEYKILASWTVSIYNIVKRDSLNNITQSKLLHNHEVRLQKIERGNNHTR